MADGTQRKDGEPPDVTDEAVATIRRLAAKAWEGILDDRLRKRFDYESFVYGYAIGASQMSTARDGN